MRKLLVIAFIQIMPSVVLGEVHFRKPIMEEPISFDPAIHDDVFSWGVTSQIYEGLFEFDDQTAVIPALAKDWNKSEDGTRYTFYLRKNVVFHNGKPLTVNDVVYSFTRILDPKLESPGVWMFELVKGAEEFRDGRAKTVSGFRVLDDYTLEIELTKPFYPFIHILATASAKIVPEGMSREELEAHPIGTGPFQFVSYEKGKSIELVKFDKYREEKPEIDRVTMYIADYQTSLKMFNQGRLDFLPILDAKDAKKLYDTGNEVRRSIQNVVWLLALNNQKPPFSDINFRKALYYALDRHQYVDIYGGKDTPAQGYLPYGVLGATPPYGENISNLTLAKEYLKKSAYKGERFVLHVPTGIHKIEEHKRYFETALKRLGVKGVVKIIDFPTLWSEKIVTKKFDAYLVYIVGAYPDPDSFLDLYFRSQRTFNLANVENQQVNALLTQGRETLTSLERSHIYQQVERVLKDQAVVIPLMHENFWVTWKPRFESVPVNTLGEYQILLKHVKVKKKINEGQNMKLNDGEYRLERENGVSLYYKVVGFAPDKPVAILLHGGPGLNAYSTEQMAGPELERLFTIVYVDQRGSGRSFQEGFEGTFHYTDFPDDLEAIRKALNIPAWNLIGHSFGGMLAIDYAVLHPEHVQNVILVGPVSGTTNGAWIKNYFQETINEFEISQPAITSRVKEFLQSQVTTDRYKEFLRLTWDLPLNPLYWENKAKMDEHEKIDAAVQPQFAEKVFFDLVEEGIFTERDVVGKATYLKKPTLIIVGEKDRICPPSEGETLHQVIPNSSIVQMNGAGHFMHLENPEQFATIIKDWFSAQ